MDVKLVNAMRSRLEAMAEEIRASIAATEDERAPVTLDQQSVGRLSRMDAMQVQAMAQATAGRRAGELRRIAAALARLEAGEYGDCIDCGEEIGLKRLEIDPAAPRCVDCAA